MIVARVIQGVGWRHDPRGVRHHQGRVPAGEGGRRGRGRSASLTAVGAGLGIVLAGPIVSALGWRYLFWLPMIVTVDRRGRGLGHLHPRVAGPLPRQDQLAARHLAVGAWLVAILVALSEAPVWGWGSPQGDRPAGRRRHPDRGLDRRRGQGAHAADRHDDDAAAGGVDQQPGRAAAGLGMYAMFAFLPRVRADPAEAGRLRVRREHHRVRPACCCRPRSRCSSAGQFAGPAPPGSAARRSSSGAA